jgi:hypothetical protein
MVQDTLLLDTISLNNLSLSESLEDGKTPEWMRKLFETHVCKFKYNYGKLCQKQRVLQKYSNSSHKSFPITIQMSPDVTSDLHLLERMKKHEEECLRIAKEIFVAAKHDQIKSVQKDLEADVILQKFRNDVISVMSHRVSLPKEKEDRLLAIMENECERLLEAINEARFESVVDAFTNEVHCLCHCMRALTSDRALIREARKSQRNHARGLGLRITMLAMVVLLRTHAGPGEDSREALPATYHMDHGNSETIKPIPFKMTTGLIGDVRSAIIKDRDTTQLIRPGIKMIFLALVSGISRRKPINRIGTRAV